MQYRETDFDFASRLMEEEGIYYYFKHDRVPHTMVIADTPQGSHATFPARPLITFDTAGGGNRRGRGAHRQLGRNPGAASTGKYTLWDHCFELPDKHLDADKTIIRRQSRPATSRTS